MLYALDSPVAHAVKFPLTMHRAAHNGRSLVLAIKISKSKPCLLCLDKWPLRGRLADSYKLLAI